MTKTINITSRDIKYGRRNSCLQCPVARALRRLFPTQSVWVETVFFDIGRWRFSIPELTKFIARFDAGKKVKPTKFKFQYYEDPNN